MWTQQAFRSPLPFGHLSAHVIGCGESADPIRCAVLLLTTHQGHPPVELMMPSSPPQRPPPPRHHDKSLARRRCTGVAGVQLHMDEVSRGLPPRSSCSGHNTPTAPAPLHGARCCWRSDPLPSLSTRHSDGTGSQIPGRPCRSYCLNCRCRDVVAHNTRAAKKKKIPYTSKRLSKLPGSGTSTNPAQMFCFRARRVHNV